MLVLTFDSFGISMSVVLMRPFDASKINSLLKLTVNENAEAEIVRKSIESDCFLLRIRVHLLEECTLDGFLGHSVFLDFFWLEITLESNFDRFLDGVFDEHGLHTENLERVQTTVLMIFFSEVSNRKLN